MKLTKTIFMLFFILACSSITKLAPTSIKSDERLIVLRLFHKNDQGDWSNSTSFMYRLDGKKASLMSEPFVAKREENNLRYVVIPAAIKVFGMDDLIFGYSGFSYHANKFGEKAISEVRLPEGQNPVYVGSFYMETGKKDWANKGLNAISTAQEVRKVEIKDELPEVKKLLEASGIQGPISKAIFNNFFPKK
jgi:hypothetical protein